MRLAWRSHKASPFICGYRIRVQGTICLKLICSGRPHCELVSWQDTTTINRLLPERSCFSQNFAFNLLLTKTDHHHHHHPLQQHHSANYYAWYHYLRALCFKLSSLFEVDVVILFLSKWGGRVEEINQKPPTKHFEINFKAMVNFSLAVIFLKKYRNQCNKSTSTTNNRNHVTLQDLAKTHKSKQIRHKFQEFLRKKTLFAFKHKQITTASFFFLYIFITFLDVNGKTINYVY